MLIIMPQNDGVNKSRLEEVLTYALGENETEYVYKAEELKQKNLKNRRVLFAVLIGSSGINLELYRMYEYLRSVKGAFEGSVGGIIVDGASELYTKAVSREIAFTANLAGLTFPGRCLVEATGDLKNFNVQAKNYNTDCIGAYKISSEILVNNIIHFNQSKKENPNILVLHASEGKTSNTLALWELVKKNLNGFTFKEISLRNGQVVDCRGCSYDVCAHFSEQGTCFYGGPIAQQVYPAILKCDALVMLCPNYNDALGGNHTAFINRLTSLFVSHRFYDKSLFAIVVSGYSGSDIIAQQLISGLNMNKTFSLPGEFVLMETANNPKEVLEIEGIEEKAKAFAKNILNTLT